MPKRTNVQQHINSFEHSTAVLTVKTTFKYLSIRETGNKQDWQIAVHWEITLPINLQFQTIGQGITINISRCGS